MAANPGMVLPPVGPVSGVVDRDCADLADVRVPAPFGRYSDDENFARPVGYYDGRLHPQGASYGHEPSPCNPTGKWAANRHLFDALMTEEGDRYDAEDNLLPKQFRLALTCLRCGVVRELRGHLDAEHGDESHGPIDPVPLQAGTLLAQQIRHSRSWGHEDAEWTVYAEGRRVGWMATERGQRGARYVVGGLGRRYVDAHQVVKGPTAVAVLRKLTKVQVSELAAVQ